MEAERVQTGIAPPPPHALDRRRHRLRAVGTALVGIGPRADLLPIGRDGLLSLVGGADGVQLGLAKQAGLRIDGSRGLPRLEQT
jgi:hypothetical protein